jgi:hypothetical protein
MFLILSTLASPPTGSHGLLPIFEIINIKIAMSIIKIITYLNWLLIAFYGYSVIWALLQVSNPSHEMPGAESLIKIVGLLLLITMVALNLSSHTWMKVTALILVTILLLIIRWFAD